MTARSIEMDSALLDELARELLAVPGLSAVLYDLTHKPPATIGRGDRRNVPLRGRAAWRWVAGPRGVVI